MARVQEQCRIGFTFAHCVSERIPVGISRLRRNRGRKAAKIGPLRDPLLTTGSKCSVYVPIALTLGKHGAIDCAADPKRKLQLTVF